MSNDLINGLFEFCGAIAVLMSVRMVIKDKCWAGLSPYNLVFFNAWSIFNLHFYPALNQIWSFRGGCFIVLANLIYLYCLWYYPHRKDNNDKDIISPDEKSVSQLKVSYVGAPAIFVLQTECREIARAFDSYGIYLVGSALARADWRDVDVRMIMPDEQFSKLFPGTGPIEEARWEFDSRWSLMTSAISSQLSKRTGLPIDFQFQPQSHANAKHKGLRLCLCLDFGNKA